jgi:Phage integrase central domain
VAERFKAAVLKTARARKGSRRFESYPFRHARRAAREQDRLRTARAMTFKQWAERYIEAHRSGWRNARHAAQWEATLATYAEPFKLAGHTPSAAN